jgi:hypothetical protein
MFLQLTRSKPQNGTISMGQTLKSNVSVSAFPLHMTPYD